MSNNNIRCDNDNAPWTRYFEDGYQYYNDGEGNLFRRTYDKETGELGKWQCKDIWGNWLTSLI